MDCFLPSHLPHCLIWQIFCIFWQLSKQLAWLISHVLVLVVTPSPQVAEQSDHELQYIWGSPSSICSIRLEPISTLCVLKIKWESLTGLVDCIDSILNKTHWAGYITSVQRNCQPFASPSILFLWNIYLRFPAAS